MITCKVPLCASLGNGWFAQLICLQQFACNYQFPYADQLLKNEDLADP